VRPADPRADIRGRAQSRSLICAFPPRGGCAHDARRPCSPEDEALRLAGAEHVRVWRLYMTGSAQAFERGELGFMTPAAA
jgi:hypothetical protein